MPKAEGEVAMNRLHVCILFSVFAVITARAEETTTPAIASAASNAVPSGVTSNLLPSTITIDGTTYEEARWERVTPTTVTIFHKTGVATIPLWKLPPDLQKEFGYDPQKAAAWSEAQEKQRFDRLWPDTIAKGEQPPLRTINGYLYDFSPAIAWAKDSEYLTSLPPIGPFVFAGGDALNSMGGSPGTIRKLTAQEQEEQQRREPIIKRVTEGQSKWSGYSVNGKVISVIPEGVLLSRPDRDQESGEVEIFLKHYPAQSSLVDGARVSVIAMRVGAYSYTTTIGGQVTVKAYDFGTRPAWKQGQQIVPLPPALE
jgi:hypothetical protein